MILVTGATGFIGRRLIQQLAQAEDKTDILCLIHKDNSGLEKTGREIVGRLGIRYLEVDLVSGEGLEKVPKSPAKVFHLASVTDTSAPDHSINDRGTKNLLEAIQPLSPEMHFIFTSSIAVYDNRGDFSVPAGEATELMQSPAHEYGRKKLAAEKYLTQMSRELGFRLSIVRVCGVYGEGVRKGGLFDSIQDLVRKKSFLSRLNWPGRISVILVEDMARFLIGIAQQPPAGGQRALYVPSVESLTLAQMSESIHKAYGLPYRGIRIPSVLWMMIASVAKNKKYIEKLLPHKMYNRFWQLFILVNDEFWCASHMPARIFADHRPTRFEDYYIQRIRGPNPGRIVNEHSQ